MMVYLTNNFNLDFKIAQFFDLCKYVVQLQIGMSKYRLEFEETTIDNKTNNKQKALLKTAQKKNKKLVKTQK